MKAFLQALAAILVAVVLTPVQADTQAAPDLAKEQRWRAQIVDSLMDGEAVDLIAGDSVFLGLYTKAEAPTGRAAIIIHGIGVHPNWTQVIYPLRTELPRNGWTTLAIQMPVLPNEASDDDYALLMDAVPPRVAAAIDYLKEQGNERIAIVAHSLGATMANTYLASHPDGISAYVAIGMSAKGAHAGQDNLALLKRIKTPMLDLYGQNDLDPVVGGATARAEAGSSNPGYHQVQVPGADHFFDGQDQALVDVVLQWLDQTVPAL